MAKAQTKHNTAARIEDARWTLRLSGGWDAAIKGALVTAAVALIVTALNVWRTQGVIVERLRVQDETVKSMEAKLTTIDTGVRSISRSVASLEGYVRAKHGDQMPGFPNAIILPYAGPTT